MSCHSSWQNFETRGISSQAGSFMLVTVRSRAALASIRKDKAQYQKKLVRRMKSSPKMFYSYVRSKQRNVVSVTKVNGADGKTSENDKDTAQLLCVISFRRCLQTTIILIWLILSPSHLMIYQPRNCLLKILFIKDCVC